MRIANTNMGYPIWG